MFWPFEGFLNCDGQMCRLFIHRVNALGFNVTDAAKKSATATAEGI